MSDKIKDLTKLDGWLNLLSGVGVNTRDKRVNKQVTSEKYLNERQLSALFHGNDLFQRICRVPAEEMVREGISFRQETDGETSADDVGKGLHQEFDKLRVNNHLAEAITYSRLYGDAFIFVGADDGQDPTMPLNFDNIREIRFLSVLDRHEVQIQEWDRDPMSPTFGQPLTYLLQPNHESAVGTPGSLVHESRLLRFKGALTTRRKRNLNGGWNDSVITPIFNTIRAYDSSWETVEILMQDFSQAVFKMKGLAETMAMNGEAAVRSRLEIMDTSRSVLRAMLIDADNEEFDRKATPMGGLPEILAQHKARVAAAAEMPQTLLFGESPQGMSGLGDAEAEMWANRVKGLQESRLRDPLEQLIKIMLNTQEGPTMGNEPETWSFEFNSIHQMDPLQEAQLRKLVADTDMVYHNMGAVLESEIAVSRFGGDEYSSETIIDVELREQMAEQEKEEMLNPPSPADFGLPPPPGDGANDVDDVSSEEEIEDEDGA